MAAPDAALWPAFSYPRTLAEKAGSKSELDTESKSVSASLSVLQSQRKHPHPRPHPASHRPGRVPIWVICLFIFIFLAAIMQFVASATVLATRTSQFPCNRPSCHPSPAATCPFFGKTLAPSNYTVVKGIFRQDEDDFDGHGYDLLKDGFGLLDKSVDRWGNFSKYIAHLNRHADAYTTYKVLWVARHGEGYHNVAESKYGTPAWNCHWSLLMGDGNVTWGPDPILTPLGESQARAANAGWKAQLKDHIPLPQSLYSSPLRRAARTLEITWGDILLKRAHHLGLPIRPIIKETLREMIGLHTCDRRSTKSLLANTFPTFAFEPSFTEHDILWDATYQETGTQEAMRLRFALNEIFATDPHTHIGITAHGGVIGAIFRAVGRRDFGVVTGGFVPIVLKATSHPTATFNPIVRGQSATAPACTVDPTPTGQVAAPSVATVTSAP